MGPSIRVRHSPTVTDGLLVSWLACALSSKVAKRARSELITGDRVPFLTDVPGGAPTLTPLENEIHHNFFIANFESSMCVDNDDGSAYYSIHDNVCIGGGHKSDFAGHSKATFNSLEIGPKKDACIRVQPSQPTVPEKYYNNSCIQLGIEDPNAVNASSANGGLVYAQVQGCDYKTGKVSDPRMLPIMHSNRIYNRFGEALVQCAALSPPLGHTAMPMANFQKAHPGFEKGSTVGKIPAVAEIVALAKGILGM
jgi:hypothetical protein